MTFDAVCAHPGTNLGILTALWSLVVYACVYVWVCGWVCCKQLPPLDLSFMGLTSLAEVEEAGKERGIASLQVCVGWTPRLPSHCCMRMSHNIVGDYYRTQSLSHSHVRVDCAHTLVPIASHPHTLDSLCPHSRTPRHLFRPRHWAVVYRRDLVGSCDCVGACCQLRWCTRKALVSRSVPPSRPVQSQCWTRLVDGKRLRRRCRRRHLLPP